MVDKLEARHYLDAAAQAGVAVAVVNESQRLIERRLHPPFARAKQLVLSPDGIEFRERLLEILNEESLMAGLTRQEQGVLQGLLQRAISRR